MPYKAMNGFGSLRLKFFASDIYDDQTLLFSNAFIDYIPKPEGVRHDYDDWSIEHSGKGFRHHIKALVYNVDDGDSDDLKILDEYLGYLHRNLIRLDVYPEFTSENVNIRLYKMLLKLNQDLGYKNMARQNAGQTRTLEFYSTDLTNGLSTVAQNETSYNLTSKDGVDNFVALGTGDNLITLNGE